MRTDHLKGWLAAATKEEAPDRTQWDVLVTLVNHIWQTGELPTVLPWSIMVLLPKPDGSSRGIGLLEVIWKLLTSIIDGRLKAAISFHDALHGFRPGRGTTTAIIEAKLFQQLASIQQVPVFEIFLDLKKAYDTLDRARTLEILERYGVGALTIQLLRRFWDRQLVVAKQGGHFGAAFPATRGVTQGDIVSPTIFNIVVDATVRYWLTLVLDDGSEFEGLGRTVQEQLVLFYADDGLLASRNPEWLQMVLSHLCELFERMGLRTNVQKTRTINDIQTVGRMVTSRMERASIIDRDQLDKISKKIRRAIAPGFQYIDINKLLESATGSALIQPIQLLQDLYIDLNNCLAKTESNEIFHCHIIDWDATGNITSSTNMITHHVTDLMAQRVIDNTTQMIQHVQASGAISADAVLRTVLNDMVFTTYKVLNSIEDPGLRAKVEADLSGHP
jgi:hypothetical protein